MLKRSLKRYVLRISYEGDLAEIPQRLSVKAEEKTQIAKRDSEIARLREQRDAARNELGERKQKEVHRLNYNESMKASYESRGVSYVSQALFLYLTSPRLGSIHWSPSSIVTERA